jgi:hypothetical protein
MQASGWSDARGCIADGAAASWTSPRMLVIVRGHGELDGDRHSRFDGVGDCWQLGSRLAPQVEHWRMARKGVVTRGRSATLPPLRTRSARRIIDDLCFAFSRRLQNGMSAFFRSPTYTASAAGSRVARTRFRTAPPRTRPRPVTSMARSTSTLSVLCIGC